MSELAQAKHITPEFVRVLRVLENAQNLVQFHVVVMQRTAKKRTDSKRAHAIVLLIKRVSQFSVWLY